MNDAMRIPLLAGVLALAAPAGAQTIVLPGTAGPTTLTINAEGRSTRTPDVARISGGVVTAAATAAEAMAENARRMTRVVAAIRGAGIAERDIQTSGLSLQPQYRYDNNQPPVLTGYQATNTVSLRLRRLAEAGRLLDTLVGVGANQLDGPDFMVDAADAALDEARTAAVATARARAELYARAAGMKVGRIVTIAESAGMTPPPRPMMRMQADAMAASAPTPVAPGEIALTVTVTMTFELQ